MRGVQHTIFPIARGGLCGDGDGRSPFAWVSKVEIREDECNQEKVL
jgi:hypothetical protein